MYLKKGTFFQQNKELLKLTIVESPQISTFLSEQNSKFFL